MAAEAIDHLEQLVLADHAGFDRLAAGRHFVEPADVHLAIMGEGERARDGRGGHDQEVRRALGLLGEHHALGDAEAVLLVHNGEAEAFVGDMLLEDGVGADEDVDRAVGKTHQAALPRTPLLPPGQDGDVDRQAGEHAGERVMMLAGEDFGRGEQGRLRAGLDRREHRHQRDEGLARADIALEQAEHRHVLLEVALDLPHRPLLRAGGDVGKFELVTKAAVAVERDALAAA